jgi:hypothetical protein
VEQYFGNPENYFELKKEKQEQKENEEPNTKHQIEPDNETPDEKYRREQEERKNWSDGLE